MRFRWWRFDTAFPEIPDDKDAIVVESEASQVRLEEAKEIQKEVRPMAESLRAHDKRNHYGERLQSAYGRKNKP